MPRKSSNLSGKARRITRSSGRIRRELYVSSPATKSRRAKSKSNKRRKRRKSRFAFPKKSRKKKKRKKKGKKKRIKKVIILDPLSEEERTLAALVAFDTLQPIVFINQ